MRIDARAISSDAAYKWMIATIVPRPIAWVSTLNEDGSANLAPFSFFTGTTSEPPGLLFVASRREDGPKDTVRNAERTGELVVNVVTEELAEAMCASSGDYPYGDDEFVRAGVKKLASERVGPPRVAESLVSMECALDHLVPVGDGGATIVLARILLWHVDDGLVDERGRLDQARLHAVARLGGSSYARIRDQFQLARPRIARKPS